MKALCCALSVCGVALFVVADLKAADTDEPKLQGKWTVQSFDYNGTPVDLMKEATREFKDGKYTLSPKVGDVIDGNYKIDSGAKPKTIDLQVNDRVLKGIYELTDDTLKLCYNLSGNERPTEFASKPDTGLILVTHKRAK